MLIFKLFTLLFHIVFTSIYNKCCKVDSIEKGKIEMNKKNMLVITLVISVLLISSMFSGTAVEVGTSGAEESLEVEKSVFDGEFWVAEIDAEIDDVVEFQISFTYHNTKPGTHWAEQIEVTDTIPVGLEYLPGSASPFEPAIDGQELTWDLDAEILYDDETYIITYSATVIDYGIHENCAMIVAYEHCCSRYINGKDSAIVNVPTPRPAINVEKYVWDGLCFWVEETSQYSDEIVSFKMVVENTGEVTLSDITVLDTLSDSLEYVLGSSDPFEPDISGKELTWFFDLLEPGEIIEITFDATVIGLPCEEDTNWVEVEGFGPCETRVTDEDSARVYINGMCMEKEVWDEDLGAWMESTEASIGETVRFRITIMYRGPKTLYNIRVYDVLPECFVYADNAIPIEPEVSGNELWWNLTRALYGSTYDLLDGEELIVEFDAEIEGGLCDECVNWAYVVANECSGRTFEWQDPATVYVDCEFTADAGGPYTGGIGEEITITGSAADGNLPYLYEWDLDDDGEYDDDAGKTITNSWDVAGDYIIRLKVTDEDDKYAYDYAAVHVDAGENMPPNQPEKPQGPSKGKVGVIYTYNSTTTDPNGDQIFYLFDWGDGTDSGWIGPYDSGEEVEINHKWTTRGSHSVKVKARDHPNLAESVWSESLPITMPKSKISPNTAFTKLLLRLVDIFPVIAKILGY